MKAIDLLNLGLGAAFLAKDKFEETLEELQKRGEISKGEAKTFLEDAKKRAEREEEALTAKLRDQIKKTIAEMGLATKTDIEELKALLAKKKA